ncbi:sulfate/molybdate ABC transporter ATP-binding protein [Tomitella cavernea]|nr:ATP-binding cassette domain-containing protein [Tomitella cavernea]
MRLAPGEVVAVLGPNGAGKSTLLSVIAGLVHPDSGRVRAGDRVLLDTATGTDVPVARRKVGLLAQDSLLFGSLSAAENVEFGPRSQGMGRQESAETARRWLAEVGAADLAARKPRKLSGGQAQRVAIARALAAGPEVLLLDEPMGSLDVAVAAQVRSMLRRVLHDRAAATGGRSAAIIVTHDLVDALTLADRIVVLDNGSVVDDGPVERVLRSPRSPFAADLAGTNMVSGHAVDAVDAASESAGTGAAGHGGGWIRRRRPERVRTGRVRPDGAAAARQGSRTPAVEGDAPSTPAAIRTVSEAQVEGGTLHRLAAGEPAVAVFSPRAVAVYRTAPHGSPRNVFPVRVTAVEARGDAIRVRASDGAGIPLMAEMTTTAARELGIAAGDEAVFVVKASEVRVYPG